MIQLGVTATFLLFILGHLYRKIRSLSRLSQEDFVQENTRLQMPVLLFVGSFYLRLIMTALQMAEVFTVIDLRQFWALQLEFLMCILCELVPQCYFIIQHMYISAGQNQQLDEDEEISNNDEVSNGYSKHTRKSCHTVARL